MKCYNEDQVYSIIFGVVWRVLLFIAGKYVIHTILYNIELETIKQTKKKDMDKQARLYHNKRIFIPAIGVPLLFSFCLDCNVVFSNDWFVSIMFKVAIWCVTDIVFSIQEENIIQSLKSWVDKENVEKFNEYRNQLDLALFIFKFASYMVIFTVFMRV